MSHENRDPQVTKLEASLAALQPFAERFNRDAVMYRAGEAAARRAGWVWPGSSAVLAVAVVTLVVMQFNRPAPTSHERIVYVPQPVESGPTADLPFVGTSAALRETTLVGSPRTESAYLTARNHVLRWGIDEMPRPQSGPGGAKPVSLESLIDLPSGADDPALKRLVQTLKPGA